jgi:hypothetical protein
MYITEEQLKEYESISSSSPMGGSSSSSSSSSGSGSSHQSIDDLVKDESAALNAVAPKRWVDRLPRVNLMLDPIINFKTKQKISFLGAQMTIGIDYLSDLAHWKVLQVLLLLVVEVHKESVILFYYFRFITL